MKIHRPGTRVLGTAAAAALVLGAGVGAEAATAKKKPKVVSHKTTYSYQGGCVLVTPVASGGFSKCPVGADTQATRKAGEKFLSIDVKDSSGRPVSGFIWTSEDTTNSTTQEFCGSIKNFPMQADSYRVTLNVGVDAACPGGEPTQGTLTETFSSKPIK